MEDQTGFELNSAIANWRAAFANREGMNSESVRELESHLRDSIASWTAKGLSAEEAFAIAAGRLGSPQNVAVEFKAEDRTEVWRGRAFWMVVGVVGMHVLSQGASFLTSFSSTAAARYFHWEGMTALAISYGTWTVSMLATLALAARWILAGKAESIRFWGRWRSRWTLGGAVVCALFVSQFLVSLGLLAIYSLFNSNFVHVSAASINGGLMTILYQGALAGLLACLAPDDLFEVRAQ